VKILELLILKLMSALNYLGRNDSSEHAFMLTELQEQAMLNSLLRGRDDLLYDRLYGTRYVRDVWQPETRGVSGRNMVMPFFN
jgi:hypothetical protein